MSQLALDRLLCRLGKLHPKYIDLSLERLFGLLKKLKNPHLKLPPVIHIAGTNGKGSTLSFLMHILIEHNYRVHCYISPHLESIKERFILNGYQIKEKKLYKTLKFIEKINNKKPITFFEILTAAAFYLFSKIKADFIILETGLGGRFDATNVIQNPIVNIITPISFDHKEYLGTSLKKITNEKLGIIKNSSSIIIGKQKNYILKHISNKLNKYSNKKIFFSKNIQILTIKKNKFILYLNKNTFQFNKPSLIGDHQIENASLAIAASYEIKKIGYKIANKLINRALIKTVWPGRLEKFYLNTLPVFMDGAHNIGGSEQLANFLSKDKKNTWLIIGMLNNKDLFSFLQKLKSYVTGVIAIKIPGTKNSFTTKDIYFICKKLKIHCVEQKNIKFAQKFLLKKICPDQIVITGSIYLIGKIRKLFI